jgi:prevent-host-death family protein
MWQNHSMRNVKDRVITARELRANLGHVLDRVIETGEPCCVLRNGQEFVVRLHSRRRHRPLAKRHA